jgi:hypothetical protein
MAKSFRELWNLKILRKTGKYFNYLENVGHCLIYAYYKDLRNNTLFNYNRGKNNGHIFKTA